MSSSWLPRRLSNPIEGAFGDMAWRLLFENEARGVNLTLTDSPVVHRHLGDPQGQDRLPLALRALGSDAIHPNCCFNLLDMGR